MVSRVYRVYRVWFVFPRVVQKKKQNEIPKESMAAWRGPQGTGALGCLAQKTTQETTHFAWQEPGVTWEQKGHPSWFLTGI